MNIQTKNKGFDRKDKILEPLTIHYINVKVFFENKCFYILGA
jgi:hypothetical protein